MKRVVVTGGAGFIGSALIRHLVAQENYEVLNLDKLTYAGNLESLRDVSRSGRYDFIRADICDALEVRRILGNFRPHAVVHLAAETHVDRSIEGPAIFLRTNVVGTCTLLMEAQRYREQLRGKDREAFRFHHVSTDEVFGELGPQGKFVETTPYSPNSPYAASKASADHFVRAWMRTFGLPVLVSNCSNNYGPYHFPEKLIPLAILKCLRGDQIPVYGAGQQVRDWLFVEDHARALHAIFERGEPGQSYNVGGNAERTNLQVVHTICDLLDRMRPRAKGSYRDLIHFVADRPGHDFRYAMDYGKLERSLGWTPVESFDSGMEKTVRWYLDNEWWWKPIVENAYHGQRLGVLPNQHEVASP
jgi:dTDP-glucose 4,6-dehydratase